MSTIALTGTYVAPIAILHVTCLVVDLIGPFVGNIIAFPLSGVLCDTIGWPYVFYCFGMYIASII